MLVKSPLRRTIWFFCAFAAYFYVLSLLDRLLFLGSISSSLEGSFVQHLGQTFYHGLKLDLSLTAYLLVLPFLFYIVQQLLLRRAVNPWLLRLYTMVPTFLFAGITVVNISLYESWGEKLSKRALSLFWESPSGLMASLDVALVGKTLLVFVLFFGVAHYFYHLVVVPAAQFVALKRVPAAAVALVGVVVLFSAIRGGYGRATLNPSKAYYSQTAALNHAAANSYWAFLKGLTKSTQHNPYQFMDEMQATALLQTIKEPAQEMVPRILNVDKPNVVLIILEGVVAQVFEKLGGEGAVTPGMNKLMEQGLNFTHAYAAADRSDKGIIGILSGFPAQGPESIIKHISKHEKLPAISSLMDSIGYHNLFYHGGQSEFYNIKSFMYAHGVHKVVDDPEFTLSTDRVSWGVYDHLVADRMMQDLDTVGRPFFSIFYTLVNHEPFEMDLHYQFGKQTKSDAYRSTVYYTDSVVSNLVQQAQQHPWYAETLFIVVSDHGHTYPTQAFDLSRPERYHIPLFMFGGALKEEYRGLSIDKVVSQVDIAHTLLAQLGLPVSGFPFSRNMLAQDSPGMAFYNSNTTFGMITDKGALSYDLNAARATYQQGDTTHSAAMEKAAKAYYQKVYQQFLQY